MPGMNMFWMIATLVAALSVIAASAAAAVTADAVSRRSRRQLPGRAEDAASEPRPRVLTVGHRPRWTPQPGSSRSRTPAPSAASGNCSACSWCGSGPVTSGYR